MPEPTRASRRIVLGATNKAPLLSCNVRPLPFLLLVLLFVRLHFLSLVCFTPESPVVDYFVDFKYDRIACFLPRDQANRGM